ncbi:site-specific DNA recombinase [Paenibacillus sp. 4624]|uniref:recombinase family protein n=1 Tax=Paenibacillus sp. 4624 TaxID=3156453 RepID=UPI003D2441F7
MKAALYIRVSTDRQNEEGFSMEAQHDILMELLEKKGMELYRVYSDPGISGRTIKKRPGIQRLIADMKEGKFDAVLVHKLDRLSRNLGDLYEFIALINKLNKRFVIASLGSEEIDTQSPMGKAFLYFNGIFAEIYSDNLREETLKGLTKKMKNGGLHMSKAPLGYDIEVIDDERKLVINEYEAGLIKEVFRMYLSGKGVVSIAKHMNGHSRGKEGGVWDSKYVRIVLQNHTYTGHNHFKPVLWEESKRIITPGEHEPIISMEDFLKVRKMMERRGEGHMAKHSYDYPYGGIVKCGLCGATYIGNASRQTLAGGTVRVYRSYRCRNQYSNKTCDAPGISEHQLQQLIFEKLQITNKKLQDKKTSAQAKSDQRLLQKEIEVSNRRRKNWMLALGDGKLSADDYANLIDEEEARMKAITAQYEEKEDYYINELSTEEIKEMMANLKENWVLIEPETQKLLVQSMFRQIVIKKESARWTIPQMLTV